MDGEDQSPLLRAKVCSEGLAAAAAAGLADLLERDGLQVRDSILTNSGKRESSSPHRSNFV